MGPALAAVMVTQGLLNMDQWKTLAEALFCSFRMAARGRAAVASRLLQRGFSLELASRSCAAAHGRQAGTQFRMPAAWLLSTGKLLTIAAL